jgi:hypothetical protein
MTDPDVRHVVCPECHTHQVALADGRLADHEQKVGTTPLGDLVHRCPGSGDWPNRARKQAGLRDATNMFASCPAATGEARCTGFPDGAHRCSLERGHPTPQRVEHVCTCGTMWFSQTGTVDQLVELLMDRGPRCES